MTGFVQIIQYRTSRFDEIQAFLDDWRQRNPQMGPSRVTVGRQRGSQTDFASIVEFPSYEAAQRNNEDPSTQEFSDFMMRMCDGPPVFTDLDVLRTDIRTDTGAARTASV